jgi:hypothetical protein
MDAIHMRLVPKRTATPLPPGFYFVLASQGISLVGSELTGSPGLFGAASATCGGPTGQAMLPAEAAIGL